LGHQFPLNLADNPYCRIPQPLFFISKRLGWGSSNESPVWIPIGSRFSIEQIITVSAKSSLHYILSNRAVTYQSRFGTLGWHRYLLEPLPQILPGSATTTTHREGWADN